MTEKREDGFRREVFKIISIGNKQDFASRVFDIALVIVIFCNLTVTLLSTFRYWDKYSDVLQAIELITIVLFTIEYILRLWTADFLYPDRKRSLAVLAFVISLSGLIDLLTFLPYYLPIFFPAGAVAFRMLRVVRIFRLFRVNAKNDAFSVILDVLYEKRNQLLFSIVLILIFMIAASLCMYDLEHEAQPDAFQNAFSGIWWAVSTLLTVGYGDIYPVTIAGRVMAIIISFLGVGMVAIPTGIISAGFVQQYTKSRSEMPYGSEHELQFVTATVTDEHAWAGKPVREIVLPDRLAIVSVIRGGADLSPIPELVLEPEDRVVICAKARRDSNSINVREIAVEDDSDWIGRKVNDLSLRPGERIAQLKRDGLLLDPAGDAVVRAGDTVILYSRG
ncbi:MAG: ion transporter [Lachnospiraceae bacterium]|nr:ion transporter [Lachnospiraceae bacterium]